MAVWRTKGKLFDQTELDFLVGLSLQATVAIENARLFAESQQRAAELATVNKVSQQLAGKLDIAALLELVGEQIRGVFKADVAYVALLDPRTGIIGFPYRMANEIRPFKVGEGLTGRIISRAVPSSSTPTRIAASSDSTRVWSDVERFPTSVFRSSRAAPAWGW